MKRLSLSLLCLLIILCISCSKKEDPQQQAQYNQEMIVGDWTGTYTASFTYNKETSDTSFYNSWPGEFSISFNADDTYAFNIAGGTAEGTFQVKGSTLQLYGEASSTSEILVLNSTDLKLEEVEGTDGPYISKTLIYFSK